MIVGWYLVGPMVAVCLDEADDEDEAREAVEGWVGAVVPLMKGSGLSCTLCGRSIT